MQDTTRHAVQVRPPDVNYSDWDSTLEPVGTGGFAVRLGLRQIGGFPAQAAARIMATRDASYRDIDDLKVRAGLTALIIRRLAEADAHADEVSRPMSHPLANPDAGQHGHPRNLRIIPKSRDFH